MITVPNPIHNVAIYTDLNVDNVDYVDLSKLDFYSWDTREQFIKSSHTIKIAIIVPDYQNVNNFRRNCQDLKSCDLVVVQSMELHSGIYNVMKEFDYTNFIFIVNGTLNFPLKYATVITNVIWMNSTAYYYSTVLKHLIDQRLTPFVPKQYQFDVLYGKPRTHRVFARDFLSKFDDREWFYHSPYYEKADYSDRCTPDNSDFWEDEIIVTDPEIAKEHCTYYDVPMQLGQVMPFKIYNKTNYSLVCDTAFDNNFSFFTEKIAKPMIANRLFIAVGGKHYLKNLKSLGFKTFDSIIDEQYDEVEDNHQRWTLALERAVWLCQQDPGTILKKIAPIVLHNSDMINRLESNQLRQEVSKFLIVNGYFKK